MSLSRTSRDKTLQVEKIRNLFQTRTKKMNKNNNKI